MSKEFRFAMLFPILAVILIASYAGSLAVIFTLLENSGAEDTGVITLGAAVVILVPLIAYMLERSTERG